MPSFKVSLSTSFCAMYKRIDILTNDDLVNIVSHFYDESEINSALIIYDI